MTAQRVFQMLVAVTLLSPPAGAAFAQATSRPAPRQGQILDVAADPVLAALPVTRLTVDIDKQPPIPAAYALAAGELRQCK